MLLYVSAICSFPPSPEGNSIVWTYIFISDLSKSDDYEYSCLVPDLSIEPAVVF